MRGTVFVNPTKEDVEKRRIIVATFSTARQLYQLDLPEGKGMTVIENVFCSLNNKGLSGEWSTGLAFDSLTLCPVVLGSNAGHDSMWDLLRACHALLKGI